MIFEKNCFENFSKTLSSISVQNFKTVGLFVWTWMCTQIGTQNFVPALLFLINKIKKNKKNWKSKSQVHTFRCLRIFIWDLVTLHITVFLQSSMLLTDRQAYSLTVCIDDFFFIWFLKNSFRIKKNFLGMIITCYSVIF